MTLNVLVSNYRYVKSKEISAVALIVYRSKYIYKCNDYIFSCATNNNKREKIRSKINKRKMKDIYTNDKYIKLKKMYIKLNKRLIK